jgi:hypothetical protein
MKKLLMLFVISTMTLLFVDFINAATYYYNGSGTISSTSSWKTNRNGTGTSPSNFTSGDVFVIQNGQSPTNSAAWSISGTNSKLWIETGATLTASSAITLSSSTTFQIDATGKYIHKNTSSYSTTIFQGTESFDAASTVELQNSSTTGPDGVVFGNLTVNFTSDPGGNVNCSGNVITVNGNLTVQNTNAQEFRIIYNSFSSKTLAIAGDFIISGGTVSIVRNSVLGTYAVNLSGNYNQTGGTVRSDNTVTLNFKGTGKTFGLSAGTLTSTNIDFNVNSGASYTMNNNLTTNKSFTVGGTLIMGTKIISGSGTFTSLSGSTIKLGSTTGLDGNVTAAGSRALNSGTNYEFNGSSAQTTGTTFPGNCNDLTVNNSVGITLSGAATVSGTLYMTSGNITTGANILTLGTSSSNLGTLTYTAGSIITGSTGGFKRWFSNSTTSFVSFPVGNSTNTMKAEIQFTAAPSAGTLTAKYITGDPGNLNTSDINDNSYMLNTYGHLGYWQVDATLTGGTYDMNLYPMGFTGINTPTLLRIIKRTNSSSLWTASGTHVNGNSTPKASRTGLSGFSQFAIAGNFTDNPLDGALPVELSSFTANIISRNVTLNWITANEQNNSGFEIQKQYRISQNMYSDWTVIGFVKGNGTTNSPTNYTFKDTKLNSGVYKYRLKQIDVNGNFEYFNLQSDVIIGTPKNFNISQNYPNPFNPSTKIDFEIPVNGNISIKLFDISGKEVATIVNENKQAGYYTVEFNASNLSSGTYFYRITSDNNGISYINTKKMLLIK